MSAFSVENSHDGKIFENYTRFEWGVELGVVAIFMLRLFVPHEFDMFIRLYLHLNGLIPKDKDKNVFLLSAELL